MKVEVKTTNRRLQVESLATIRSISIAARRFIDGRQIELRNDGVYVQWRYAGEETWQNLIALAELKGARGERGPQGIRGETGPKGDQGPQGPATTSEFFIALTAAAESGYDVTDKKFHYRIAIGNYREELSDPAKYRLCYMYTRRAHRTTPTATGKDVGQRYIKWVVPMLGVLLRQSGLSTEESTFERITGHEVDIALLTRGIGSQKNQLYTDTNGFTRFGLTRNTRWKTGIALFKYTGAGNPGWYRCSNIFGLEFTIGNRLLKPPHNEVNHVNSSLISE